MCKLRYLAYMMSDITGNPSQMPQGYQQPPMQGGGSGAPEDLTMFVQSLLDQMQGRFSQMSETIINRIDEMGSRIDELEQSINDLMEQAGVEPDPEAEGGDVGHNGAAEEEEGA